MNRYPVDFNLPGGRTWDRVVDTQRWWDFDDPNNDNDFFDQSGADRDTSHNVSLDAPQNVGNAYQVQDSSIVVLRAARN